MNPFADLLAPIAYRSWDSDRRLAETEADGIAAEVLFPNTVPPFFDEGNLVALPPTPEADYERRWAGVQAHNRWLADFCAPHTGPPGRHRPGLRQRHRRRPRRGALGRRARSIPSAASSCRRSRPTPTCRRLWEPHYEPLWRLCDELDVPINIHGGSGAARLRRARGGPGHDADRDPLVQPPPGVAPHLLAACSSATRRCGSRSPSRAWPGCPGASRRSTGSTAE